jgi:hypothetical protein
MSIAQKGVTVLVGYGTYSYSVVTLESVEETKGANVVKTIADQSSDTKTVLTADPYTEATLKGIVLGAAVIAAPAISAVLNIGTFTGRVTASSISFQREEAVLTVTVRKEDSMTY